MALRNGLLWDTTAGGVPRPTMPRRTAATMTSGLFDPFAADDSTDSEYSAKGNATMVVPLEQRFWDDLLSSSLSWGLTVYEQDWLCKIILANEHAGMCLVRLDG